MYVNFEVQYTIGDILDELGEATTFDPPTGIIPLNMQDKLFLGGGCEASITPIGFDSRFKETGTSSVSPENVSICVSGPIL